MFTQVPTHELGDRQKQVNPLLDYTVITLLHRPFRALIQEISPAWVRRFAFCDTEC
jgi:hypothetical protein